MNSSRDQAVGVTDEGAGRERRDRILEAVTRVLTDEKRAATDIEAVVEDSGLPLEEVIGEFPDFDDLVVAIASQQAARVIEPLRSAMQSGRFEDVRSELIQFGAGLRAAFSSVVIGFLRVALEEESIHKELGRRIYEQGPAAVETALRDYLDAAARKGKLAFANMTYAAESLIGMLREPLYQELTVHSQEFTFYGSAEEAVEQAVDRFLWGCDARDTGP